MPVEKRVKSKSSAGNRPGNNEKPARKSVKTKKISLESDKARPINLKLRRRPLRQRGQATFESILDATAILLEQLGHEAVNTNNIAEAANIIIASLYQYFSNKQAILVALYDRHTLPRVESAAGMLALLKTQADWRALVGAAIDDAAKRRRNQRGLVGLRLALKSSPALQIYERLTDEPLIKAVSEALVVRAGLPMKRAKLIARLAVEMATLHLDIWSIEGRFRNTKIIDEAKTAVTAYLAIYLDA